MATATPAARRLREMSVDDCVALLRTQPLGRLAYVVGDAPEVVPLNYAVYQGAVVFRTGYGDLLDRIHKVPVVFEVDHVDPMKHTGWSVIVHGLAEEIFRIDELEAVRQLPLRPWAPGERDHYVRIESTRITGRVIT
jgi:nitroimidazol reductase NimA-like FMN-containing flavoprotein (pyridoxamine 5'-phosphate oxidase superfamily)